MQYLPSWKDSFYTLNTSGEPVTYSIQSEESGSYTVIYTGKAYPAPGESSVEIPVGKICRNYLDNLLPDNWPSVTSFDNTNAVVHFQLTTGTSILEDYIIKYDNSYEEWTPSTSTTEQVSDHIKSSLAPGMYWMNTVITSSLTSMTTLISDEYTGGEVYIRANNGKYLNTGDALDTGYTWSTRWTDEPQAFTIIGNFPSNFKIKAVDGGFDGGYLQANDNNYGLWNDQDYDGRPGKYVTWQYLNNSIISIGKSEQQGDTFSISTLTSSTEGSHDEVTVTLDSMTIPMNFVPVSTSGCGRFALYYLQPNGGWSQYLFPSPASMRTDDIGRNEVTKASRNTDLSFGRYDYRITVKPTWSLVTGWVDDEESYKIANWILPSRSVYLHDLCQGFIVPVRITDEQVEHKDSWNQKHRRYSYTITVESSKDKIVL